MLSKRVEVLFEPAEYERLVAIARRQHKSIGQLLREAAAEKFLGSVDERKAAILRIVASEDDVGTWEEAKELLQRRFADFT